MLSPLRCLALRSVTLVSIENQLCEFLSSLWTGARLCATNSSRPHRSRLQRTPYSRWCLQLQYRGGAHRSQQD